MLKIRAHFMLKYAPMAAKRKQATVDRPAPTRGELQTTAKKNNTRTVLARLEDGTLQITFVLPYETVQKVRESQLKRLVEGMQLPGFRKGKAPKDLAMNHVDKQRLYELTLQHLLPEYYTKAMVEHNLKPVLQPRFELVSVEEEKDWTIRAITCELPEINLGDYKKKIAAAAKPEIWTPAKGDPKANNKPSREEKEQQIIKALLETTNVNLPKLLLDEEVNHKLAQLLDQVQKLGLTVEQYLASTGKSLEQIRLEYARQSEESIKLVLILNRVAQEEGLQVTDSEIEAVISATAQAQGPQTQAAMSTPEQRALIRAVLFRRKALDSLVNQTV